MKNVFQEIECLKDTWNTVLNVVYDYKISEEWIQKVMKVIFLKLSHKVGLLFLFLSYIYFNPSFFLVLILT